MDAGGRAILVDAAETVLGDATLVGAWVEPGAEVNIPDGSGSTPLSRSYRETAAIPEKAGAK